jgi:tetratricopeptide (TPR) repeat protein
LVSCTPTAEPRLAEAAYELRMSGKLDEAQQILEDALAQDPDYAAGHFELARIMLHASLGDNPRKMDSLLTATQQSIDRAMAQDSSSAIYPFFAGHVGFMRAYLAMNLGETDAAERVAGSCDAFEAALRLKPDYREARLHLVELYGLLPAEMGGDRSRAEAHMSELAKTDEVYGMKAQSVLGEVSVADWQTLREKHPRNTDVLEELGKACLWEGDLIAAGECFDEAVAIDSSEVILFLDLGRYHLIHTMELMRSEEQGELQMHLAAAETAMRRYLETEHPAPMKAYALRMLSHVKHGAGDKEEGDRLKEEAKALDPYHSRATGSPGLVLFAPPGTILQDHRYLTRPF